MLKTYNIWFNFLKDLNCTIKYYLKMIDLQIFKLVIVYSLKEQ